MQSNLGITVAETGQPEKEFVTIFVGKSGVGKSEIMNRLFGLNGRTDPIAACTMKPTETRLTRQQLPHLNWPVHRVVDMRGFGESLAADRLSLPDYELWGARADRFVYVTQADTRAYKRDQLLLLHLRSLLKADFQFKLVLNQVDRLGCDEVLLDANHRAPSAAQLRQLAEKIDDVFSVFAEVLAPQIRFEKPDIIPCVATHGWGMQELRRLFFNVEEC